MGIFHFGEPDLAAYVRYVAGFCGHKPVIVEGPRGRFSC